MQQRLMVIAALAIAPAMVSAQAPMSPAATCSSQTNSWFNAAYSAARDSAKLPGAKPLNLSSLVADRTTRLKTCAEKISLAQTTGPALIDLARLYASVQMDSAAEVAGTRRLGESGLTEADRADALLAMVAIFAGGDTLKILRGESYVTQLDHLSSAADARKMQAHLSMLGRYRYLDVDARIRQHAEYLLAMGKHLKAGPQPPRGVPMADGVAAAYTLIDPYNDLAEVYGDMGQTDSALRMLDQVRRDHPEITDSDYTIWVAPERARYALVGTHAVPLEAAHWLNADAKHAPDVANHVTVIEFTAHWCVPCRNSYPSMTAMAAKYQPAGVQFLFATEFYGYIGSQLNLTPEQEYVGDQHYFGDEHGIHFPVAIADAPPRPEPGKPYVFNPNDTRYHVGGIPQTVIIDRHGVIRRILTGWDTGNAERIPALVSALLKEK